MTRSPVNVRRGHAGDDLEFLFAVEEPGRAWVALYEPGGIHPVLRVVGDEAMVREIMRSPLRCRL